MNFKKGVTDKDLHTRYSWDFRKSLTKNSFYYREIAQVVCRH